MLNSVTKSELSNLGSLISTFFFSSPLTRMCNRYSTLDLKIPESFGYNAIYNLVNFFIGKSQTFLLFLSPETKDSTTTSVLYCFRIK